MTKKRIVSTDQPSLLEAEIIRIVDKAMLNSKVELTADDIKLIARDIMPDLDKMISDKIKLHFVAILKYLLDQFSIGE